MNESLKQELESIFKNIKIIIPEETRTLITVKKEDLLSILKFLKEKEYNHLVLVSCVDWIEEREFELVYILTGYIQGDEEHRDQERLHLIVKIKISRENPKLQTITGIYSNAEPYEREIHELFGIHFEGHPRLTPLLLERDYEIPPFRKDFDTRKYVKDVFEKIPFVEDKDK